MKRTKREENSIIAYALVFVLLNMGLISILIVYIIPWFKEVNWYKKEVLTLHDNYTRVKKEWLSLVEFNSTVESAVNKDKSNQEDWYLSEILKSVDEKFYNDKFINKKETDFSTHIDSVTKKYSNIDSFNDNYKFISTILPLYSESVSDTWENSLTDYKFISYIESIAETFNLSFKDPIWIWEVKLVEEYTSSIWDKSLEANLFYIPLSLEVIWSKQSILDFLYFVDNVWNIKVLDNWNLIINSSFDNDFSDFSTKILKWQEYTESYSIFNNQLFDINSIKFEKYLDSSFDINNSNLSFVKYLKDNQWSEKIKVNLNLRFYVKWIPFFKIEKHIKDFITEFTKLQTDFKVYLKKTWNSGNPKLMEMNSTLNQLQNSVITQMKASLSKKEGVDESYKQVNNYSKILEEYRLFLEQFNK